MNKLRKYINKYIQDEHDNLKVHLQINAVCKEIIDNENELDSVNLLNKYTQAQKKCCFLKNNGNKCTNIVLSKNFCKTHVKYESTIKQFLEPELNFDLIISPKPKDIIDYTGFNKIFIQNSFFYTKDNVVYNHELIIVGYMKSGECIFECDPFISISISISIE